jgi:hypothetical protein
MAASLQTRQAIGERLARIIVRDRDEVLNVAIELLELDELDAASEVVSGLRGLIDAAERLQSRGN